MSLLTTFILLFQAINPFTTITVTDNMPQYYTGSVFGVTTCHYDRVEIDIWRESNVQTFLHEFAHAYDCLDNHYMDGSPIQGLCPPSLECAEAYANHVEYTNQYR